MSITVWNNNYFLDSPSTSLRVVSMPNYGSRDAQHRSSGMTGLYQYDKVSEVKRKGEVAFL